MRDHIHSPSARRDAQDSLSRHAIRRSRGTALLSVLLAVAALPASAQQAATRNAGEVMLDPITVKGLSLGSGLDLRAHSNAGSRLGLSVLQTPASVQVIEAETIRQRGQRDVNQAIVQNGTGISFHGSPGNGGTSLSMRGFNGHGSVTRLYDGTRLYPASGTISFPFDSWSVERIEVLNGPSSVLYGEGAVGGAINIVPKRPLTDRSRNEIRATLGTDGQRGLALGSAGPINEVLAYSIDVSGTASDGWLDRNDTSSRALSAALRWQATEDLALTLSHDHGDNRPGTYFGTPLVDGRIDERVRRRNFNVEDALVRYKDSYTQLRAEWTPADNVTIRSNSYYLASDRNWRNVEDYLYRPDTGDVLRQFYIAINHDLEQVGNRTDATISTTPGGMENTTTIGFDVNRITFRNTNNSPYPGESVVDFPNPRPGLFGPHQMATTADLTTDQYALFLDNRLKINEQWSVVGGLRHDNLRVTRVEPAFTRSFDSVSWRLGAVYSPLPDVAIYAQYSRAAEPIGNVLSLSQSQADLKLAKARQQEIGVKFAFLDGRGDATLSAYRIVKNDLLARDPDDPAITRQIGQQSSKGIEAAVGFDVAPNLRIDVNGALLSPRYDDYVQSGGDYSGNRPPNAPRRVANIWGSWAFAEDWTVRAGAHYVGEVFTNDANTTSRPSYTVVNAGLQWVPRDNMSLDLNIYNLTDRLYATSGGSNQWLLAPPRSATLDLRIAF
ncbi:TonB-dependent siderophore receptor [Paracoccus sp. SSJ]|uniref:TonB-dependent receptor n=1 Tax=Paracoccus sp. SSJ TaxID=3050636 RepID=UPI0025513129|nr:TonB-dependent siderophore receptor [Paracoccus sp. SSJ]MDK8871216.1 TonB-dependent siderophore receptor [Paracoccus sp. SSJ]